MLAETLEPDVKIMSLSILSPGRPDIFLPLPVEPNAKGVWFTLKEGSPYRLKFTFSVSNNIVSGLRYTNTVWKTGLKGERDTETLKANRQDLFGGTRTHHHLCARPRPLVVQSPLHHSSRSAGCHAVDRAKEMLGTFSPQLEPYTYVTAEDTTPSGMFARGSYSARTKVRGCRTSPFQFSLT